MIKQRLFAFGVFGCALCTLLFTACGSGSGGAGGSGGAAGAAGGKGGKGGSGGTHATGGAGGGQAGAAGTAGQAGSGGGASGQAGSAGSAGQAGASGTAGAGGATGGAGGGQAGAAGTAGQAGAGGGSGQAGSAGGSGQAGAGGAAGQGGASGSAGGTGGSPPSTFSCSDLGPVDADASSRSCFDFSAASQASSWTPDGGTWSVVNGQYVGTGPSAPVTCTTAGSLITASLVNNFSAANVRLHVQMTSIDRPDKVIVLRSQDSGDRVELNFIAYWNDNGTQAGGVLSIQELTSCAQSFLVPTNTVSVPHNVGDTLTVDLVLRGTQLTVDVGGSQVFDGPLTTILTAPGGVGLGVITGETVDFDDFWVEDLD